MANTRIFDRDAKSVTKWHEEADGTIVLQKTVDVEPVLERAKELHNMGAHTTGMGDKHVASIPVPVLVAWASQRGVTFGDVIRDRRLMAQFLEDPDNSYFRIWKGRL